MLVYKVGGYVRDTLMGREPKDVDYVVVGSSQSELLDLGFEQVGADFPVFLHPETGDEWALARTERKSGTGYHGFTVETGDNLNPELAAKFAKLGYDLDTDYPLEELIQVFRQINQ